MALLSTARAFSPLGHCWQHSTLCIFKFARFKRNACFQQTIKNRRSAIFENFSALLSSRSGRKISIWICRKSVSAIVNGFPNLRFQTDSRIFWTAFINELLSSRHTLSCPCRSFWIHRFIAQFAVDKPHFYYSGENFMFPHRQRPQFTAYFESLALHLTPSLGEYFSLYKKATVFWPSLCVGAIYLPRPSPAKYCRQKWA